MGAKKKRRRNGIIDRLDPVLKDAVDQMLLSGATYREIVEYLGSNKVQLSKMAVCTYARKFLATSQMLRVAQDNFKMLTDEIDRHPELDTTEGIIRIMSNAILNTLANATPDDWQGVDMEKLLREANSLVRAAAHKKRVDMQNRTATDTAFEANKSILFDVLSRKHPELYKQVIAVINEEKDILNDD